MVVPLYQLNEWLFIYTNMRDFIIVTDKRTFRFNTEAEAKAVQTVLQVLDIKVECKQEAYYYNYIENGEAKCSIEDEAVVKALKVIIPNADLRKYVYDSGPVLRFQ